MKYLTDVKPADLAPLIDHTCLSPTATYKDIERLCGEAREYGFASVCVHPARVELAACTLKSPDTSVCAVVGFPFGANDSYVKAVEAQTARTNAREIDMVVNVGLLYDDTPSKGESWYEPCRERYGESSLIRDFKKDIACVAKALLPIGPSPLPGRHGILKCIIETAYLTPEQVREATQAVVDVAAQFPQLHFFTKTSTGYAQDKLMVPKYDDTKCSGARVEDLEIIAAVHSSRPDLELGIKASGGIKTFEDSLRMLEAMGARSKADLNPKKYRIGTSAGVQIVSG